MAMRPDYSQISPKVICMRTQDYSSSHLILALAASTFAAPQATAPHDPPLIDAAGYQKILADNHGKPLLITFWATWCEPCRAEFPMLNELIKEYQPKGLKVIGINLDDDGDLILTRRFIARYKAGVPELYRKRARLANMLSQRLSYPVGMARFPRRFFMRRMGIRSGICLAKAIATHLKRPFGSCWHPTRVPLLENEVASSRLASPQFRINEFR